MHAWEAVQKSVDYIEEHLQENIRAEALAEINRTVHHFIFKDCLSDW